MDKPSYTPTPVIVFNSNYRYVHTNSKAFVIRSNRNKRESIVGGDLGFRVLDPYLY
jgi:hypothetical protein